jgi:hypothetical protein
MTDAYKTFVGPHVELPRHFGRARCRTRPVVFATALLILSLRPNPGSVTRRQRYNAALPASINRANVRITSQLVLARRSAKVLKLTPQLHQLVWQASFQGNTQQKKAVECCGVFEVLFSCQP